MAHVRVRLFAALRDLAGSGVVEADGETAGAVLDELCRRFGDRFERVARSASLVVDGERADADRPLRDRDEVAILPPVSGGV
jgi:MoaD family protein